jgi:hypothetical protein
MSKKSDDSIDRIFRQALTQYDTKFHEDDWLKMEKLLNEEARRQSAVRSKRIKGTAYTLTGLTVLFIVVYFLANKNPSGSIATLSDSITEMQASEPFTDNGNVKRESPSDGLLSQSNPNEPTKAGETESNALPEVNDSKDQSSPIESKRSAEPLGVRNKTQDAQRPESGVSNNSASDRRDETTVPLQKSGSRDEGAQSFQTEFRLADKPGLEPSNKSNPSLTSPGEAEAIEAVDDKLSRSDYGPGYTNLPATSGESGKGTLNDYQEIKNQAESNSGGLLPEEDGKAVPLAIDSASIAEEAAKTILADSTSVVESLSRDASKSKPTSRWSVGFVVAPEFSTTKLTNYSSPGESYGLRIAYQLSNKFSVNTGIIRSQKKYEGSGEGYYPRNPAYWQIRTNGVVPEEIYSKCLVYELPLGMQFDAIQTSKSRLFVSTAISSYFMISQAYDYTFESPNPGADTGWRSRGSESYWFSVGMVSAGYERYITRSFAIGIEPYLKISLSEIGWPNIKLYSTGAYVTLRYKFMSRRNF